jgi:hypothetical protein
LTSSNLEERVRLLEEERSVLRTLHSYGHSIDYGLEESWVDLFTDDGSFDVRSRVDGERRVYSGHEELKRYIAGHSRAPYGWHKHVLIEPIISLADGSATCESYFVLLFHHEGAPLVRAFGRYRDRLTRGPDGRWRFAERIAEVESLRNDLPSLREGWKGGSS